jgi:hypothetical protein
MELSFSYFLSPSGPCSVQHHLQKDAMFSSLARDQILHAYKKNVKLQFNEADI